MAMVSRRELGWMLMKNAVAAFVWVGGLPSAVLLVLGLLGFSLRPLESYAVVEIMLPYVTRYGWLGLLALVIGVGFETTYRTINEDRSRARERYYAIDHEAKLDRAHRVFCELKEKGASLQNGTAEQWQTWDQEVRVALDHYCYHESLVGYLMATGRSAETETALLRAEALQKAVVHIVSLLDPELEGVFK